MAIVRRLLASGPIPRLAIAARPALLASLPLLVACTTGAPAAPPRLVPAAPAAAPTTAAPPALRVVACAATQQPITRTFSTYAATADASVETDASGWGSIQTGGVGTFGGPPPTLQLRAPVVVGALDAAIVRRYLRRQMLPLVDCYDQRLTVVPALAGTVALHFTITARGAVADATATGVDGELGRCVVAVVGRIEFPRPRQGTVDVTYQLAYRNPAPVDDREPWAPFDSPQFEPLVPSDAAIAATEATVTARLPALAACFASPSAPTGALRAMLEFGDDGVLVAPRVGGLGDAAIEGCLAAALDGATVADPGAGGAVACDLARGEPQPWRITPDPRYALIEVGRDVRYADKAIDLAADRFDVPPDRTVLLVADATTPAAQVGAALAWTGSRRTVLLAVRVGAGAPTYVAGFAMSQPGTIARHSEAPRAALGLRAGKVSACVAGAALGEAAIDDRAAIDRLLATVATRCAAARCEPLVEIVATPDTPAGAIAAASAAADRIAMRALVADPLPTWRCAP
ncbi:MAG: AgmX/PglI C-terminal domain-containing protein [Deltaproteobacteria bacterium]|nr:AgmX/PglI C-terminal domain-containing protein [Deltaproteobacteria bacterium]